MHPAIIRLALARARVEHMAGRTADEALKIIRAMLCANMDASEASPSEPDRPIS